MTNNPDTLSPATRLLLAALLAAPLTTLGVRLARVEAYETEKVALLGMVVAVALAGLTVEHWRPRRPTAIAASVIGLVGATLLATGFALDISGAWWGDVRRAQGAVTLLLYAVLFWGASRPQIAHRLAGGLVPVLVMLAVALVWFALQDRAMGGAARAAATTGNPNYLSSWLAITTVYLGVTAYGRHLTGARNGPLLAGVALVTALAFTLTLSRGALAGMLAGGVLAVVLLAQSTGNRRLAVTVLGGVGILAAGYALVVALVGPGAAATGATRLLQPFDTARLDLWGVFPQALATATQPTLAFDGTPDRWAALRPLFGFGPESVTLSQARYGEIPSLSGLIYIDSFHNHLFDAFYTTGGLGLFAWLAVIETTLVVGLRRLGFLAGPRLLLAGIGAQAVGVALTWGLLLLVLPTPTHPLTALPLAVGVGLVAGLVGGLALHPAPVNPAPPRYRVALVALVAAVVAHWVDIQFAFTQAASAPLWWLLLGTLAGLAAAPTDIPLPAAPPALWWAAAFGVGAFCLMFLGVTLNTDTIRLRLYAGAWWPVLLLVTGLAWVGTRGAGLRPGLTLLAGGWGTLLLVKWGGVAAFSALLADQIPAPVPSGLRQAFLVYSLSGVVVMAAALAASAWATQVSLSSTTLNRFALVLLLAGSIAYTTNASASTLHGISVAFTTTDDPVALRAARVAQVATARLTPNDPLLHLNIARTVTRSEPLSPARPAAIQRMFAGAPYYNNTMMWRVFVERNPDLGTTVPGW